jgi:hypothetical protein
LELAVGCTLHPELAEEEVRRRRRKRRKELHLR